MPTHPFVYLPSIALLTVATVGLSQSPTVDLRLSNEQTALLKTIEAKSDPFETAKACQRLAEIGDARAIEPLAKLLSDPQLSNYARNAFEGIPDPKARVALRQSLGRLQGELLVGAIGSVGRLRDADAIDELAKQIRSKDDSVAAAAGRALARIGTARSAEILKSAFPTASKTLQKTHALACLQCAQRLMQADEQASGQAMLDFLRASDVDEEIKMAAGIQAILAGGSDGTARLVDHVRSADASDFVMALQAVRQMKGDRDALAQSLADELPKLSAERQAAMIRAIADLGSKLALAPVRELAKSGALEVKLQAFRLLSRQQDSSALNTLFDAATSKESTLADVARTSLADWPSDEIDHRVLAMLAGKDASQVEAAIELSGRRRLTSANAMLVSIAKGSDAGRRALAIEALGACGTLTEFPSLLAIATTSTEPDDRRAAREATRIACVRLPQSACATAIDQAISKSTGEARVYLMDQLAAVGGPVALESLGKIATNAETELQDAATRLLGEWLTPDVAPVLLELSKSLSDDRFKTRAIRGYIRVARQLDMPMEARIDICRQALSLSSRPEETTLVLAVLRQYPSLSGLKLISMLLDKPTANDATCNAGLVIAQKIYSKYPSEVRSSVEKIASVTHSPETDAACQALLAQMIRP